MRDPVILTSLCQAVALPEEAGAPAFVHLLPAGTIETVDGRGPYRVREPGELVENINAAGAALVLDENHSTDLAAPKGFSSPARGWMTALEAREDGIWAKVEWTPEGKALAESRAYRFISPVITHTQDGAVTGILRAALVNRPNLRGLTALHAEGAEMEMMAKLRKALGLPDDADEAAIMAAIEKLKGGAATAMQSALQSSLAPIAKAAGLKDDADATAILGAVTTLATAGAKAAGDVVTALQAELTTVTTELNGLKGTLAKDKATAFVDGEISRGRVGVKPLREHYIAMHSADPARVEKEIGALPILGASGALQIAPKTKDGEVALNAEQLAAAKALGIPLAEYRKTLAAEAAEREAA